MKLLVLAENYTNLKGVVSLQYIHTRNIEYINQNIEVDVLSFRTKEKYVLDNVNVYPESYFTSEIISHYDLVLSHAPNIKNHLRFLKKWNHDIGKIVMFFHGHEVFDTTKIYPKDYPFLKNKNRFRFVRKLYDKLKLYTWKEITKRKDNIYYIFVSEWMKDMFLIETKVKKSDLPKYQVIPNSVGEIFRNHTFKIDAEREYDVITIRNNFDGSKYGVDLVVKQAINNPNLNFCLVGLGEYFDHNTQPSNLQIVYKNLNHAEVVQYLSKAKVCYLPTRLDAQGVMACEIATFSMPLITSDLDICIEMLSDFENVDFLNNSSIGNFQDMIEELYSISPYQKNDKFYSENTIGREIEFFKEIVGKSYD